MKQSSSESLGGTATQTDNTKNIVNQLLAHLKSNKFKLHFSAEMKEYLKKYNFENLQKAIQYNEEITAIKDAAIKNGTFMKAPNGKPTKLNEQQWLQVRTTNFKNWFGDWENDPENASKVIDENGEPLVVYHGSDSYGFNVFDPSKSDDKISLFTTDSKYIASTYTKHQPIHSPLVKNALLKADAIELIKNKDWKALQTVINNIVDTSLPKEFAPWGNFKENKENIETLNKIKKELNNSDLTENEKNSLLQQLSDAEYRYYFSGNYKFDVTSYKSFDGKETIEISIGDSYKKRFYSSYFSEGGVIFRGNPEELIDSLTYDTKIYNLFLNIKNPLILGNQKNEFGAALHWNNLNFSEAFHTEKNRGLWGEEIGGNHKETHTRDVARYAKNNKYDGVIIKQIVDRGGYAGDSELNPETDDDIAYDENHYGEDSYNGDNIFSSDVFISFKSNQIKSATDNNGNFSLTDDNIQAAYKIDNSNINDSLTYEDKEDILREIKKINRAKRTLIDIGGDFLFIVDHTDKEGIEFLTKEQQKNSFLCKAKIDIRGLEKEKIIQVKNIIKDTINGKGISGTLQVISRELERNGFSRRLYNSDSIDAKDKTSNIDNVGLDKQTSSGESRRGQSSENSHINFGTGQVKTGFDGTNGPRYTSINQENDLSFFTTPQGEIYGFVTKDGEIYLDETVISPEHPIHEYTHLWDRMVQQQNPELWKRGVELMKKTSMWTEIANSEHYGKLWEQRGCKIRYTLRRTIIKKLCKMTHTPNI